MTDTRAKFTAVKLRERYRIPGGAYYMAGEVVGLPTEDAEVLLAQGKADPVEPTLPPAPTPIPVPVVAPVAETRKGGAR